MPLVLDIAIFSMIQNLLGLLTYPLMEDTFGWDEVIPANQIYLKPLYDKFCIAFPHKIPIHLRY